ncbi:MAG: hypothetical protein ACKVPY_00280 [Paracoccaceae bacterium]
MDEAVRANVGLALRLCLQSRANVQAAIPAFTAAGFTYTPTAEANGDVWHRFFGPADTVRAEILQGQMASSCDVHTNHLPPSEAAPLIRGVLDQAAPGRFVPLQAGQETCAIFSEPVDAIPLMVTVGATDSSAGCPALGSTVISTFFAV